MSHVVICIIGLALLLLLLFSGMNIGFALLLVGFFGYAAVTNIRAALSIVSTLPYTTAATYSYTVIGLFVLMGFLCFYSGLSNGLFEMADKWLNWLPGGLACATVAACAGFGAICGSGAATASTMAVVAVPEMRKHGYSDALACGVTATSGTLGLLIPPSTGFIIYGILTETSIGQLFAAGIIPGIVLALCLIFTIVIWCKIDPSIAPRKVEVFWKARMASLIGVIPVLLLFLFVIGGIFVGIFTTTEAATAGCFGAVLLMIIRRQFTWQKIKNCLISSVKTVGMIYLILTGASVLSSFLVIGGLPAAVANYVIGMNLNRYVVLLAVCIIYLVLGCLMDTLPIIVLVMPVFLPVLLDMGFNIVWFGVVTTMLAMIGMVTPPVGVCAYVVSGVIKDVPLQTIFKGVFPLLIGNLVAIFLVIAFPQLSLWLPSLLY